MKPEAATAKTVTVHVPLSFAMRGGRKDIISELSPAPAPPRADGALLKALARAYRWRRQIEGGEYSSITELARAQNVNQSYACRLLRLTLLAPAVVKDILDGCPGGNMLKDLTKPFPVRWDQQVAAIKLISRETVV